MALKHGFASWHLTPRKVARPALHFVWLLGFLCGALAGIWTEHWYPLWIHTATVHQASVIGCIVPALLPLILAGYAAYINKPFYLYLICFIEAFFFTHCGFSVVAAFGQAGWLVRPLFQFSEQICIPVLYWFSLRRIAGDTCEKKRDLLISSAIAATACGIDYCIVSPFLAMLIEV